MPTPRVKVYYTGGTIGSLPIDPNNPNSALDARPLDDTLDTPYCAGLRERMRDVGGGIHYDTYSVNPPIDSSRITPQNWIEIAKLIEADYSDYDGFVILHGTDTMVNTASALAFMFDTLDKPIVLTGSQVPLSSSPTDARANLLNALWVASRKDKDLIPEVSIVFGPHIVRGCCATKFSPSRGDAFHSVNVPALGRIEPGRIYVDRDRVLAARETRGVPSILYDMYSENTLSNRIKKIELAPDSPIDRDISDNLQLPEVKAVILATYGAGNAPSDEKLTQALVQAAKNECLIVNVTQCPHGKVAMGQYAASSELLEHGVVSGIDMTDATVRAKIRWSQVRGGTFEQRRRAMQISQRGEQSEDLHNVMYRDDGGNTWAKGITEKLMQAEKPAKLSPDNLISAFLRFSRLSFEDPENASDACMMLFLNKDPTANDAATHINDATVIVRPSEVGTDGSYAVEMAQDVRDELSVAPYLNFKIVVIGGAKVSFGGLFLAMFARPAIEMKH